jgi:uncharacterized protein
MRCADPADFSAVQHPTKQGHWSMKQEAIHLGKGEHPQELLTALANRHGLIAGATGTGKTVTLRVLAEGFSRRGVPVFLADVKGDLSGLAMPGAPNEKFTQRAAELGYADEFRQEAFPVVFWDLYGEAGHPVRAVVQDMGPLLLSRLLDLNEVQEGILNIAFAVSEAEDLPLLDFKDLRSLLANLGERAGELQTRYGNISSASLGAIQRRLLALEREDAERFFGEPELELGDLMRLGPDGRGPINILMAERLYQKSPKLYAIFLMWLLSRLFEELPERGDADRPKLVFFFDEAHLLFSDAPKALVTRIEQVARLIRSKGVGVYFISQSPSDIPDEVLGQLGNRVQHALRAFTPKDQKAVRAAAQSFRANPKLNTEAALMELGVGEALVSTLDAKGTPHIVDRVKIVPPASRLGVISPEERRQVLEASPLKGKYDQTLDRDSAHERLQARKQAVQAGGGVAVGDAPSSSPPRPPAGQMGQRRQSDSVLESMAKSMARSAGTSIGRQIVRSLLGALFKK